jgi:hypothetical protein
LLYIAGEGGKLTAWDALLWLTANGVYDEGVDRVPFRLLTADFDLMNQRGVEELIRIASEEFAADYGELPGLVVIECKTMAGKLTQAQREWLTAFEACGAKTMVARGDRQRLA